MNNYQEIKRAIFPRLISTELAEEYTNAVKETWGDCAVVYICNLGESDDGFIITPEHLTAWNITLAELHTQALDNVVLYNTPVFANMESVILELTIGEKARYTTVEELQDVDRFGMYVLTNETKYFGANALLLDWVLEKLGEVYGSDLVILPSSVHEVIVLSADFHSDLDAFLCMVQEINATEVKPADQLSNSVYIYSKAENKLYRYTDGETFPLLADEEVELQSVEEII